MLAPAVLGELAPAVFGELALDGDAALLDEGGLTPASAEDMLCGVPDAPDGFVVPVAAPVIAAGREALHAAANSGNASAPSHARFLRDPCTKFIASETHT